MNSISDLWDRRAMVRYNAWTITIAVIGLAGSVISLVIYITF